MLLYSAVQQSALARTGYQTSSRIPRGPGIVAGGATTPMGSAAIRCAASAVKVCGATSMCSAATSGDGLAGTGRNGCQVRTTKVQVTAAFPRRHWARVATWQESTRYDTYSWTSLAAVLPARDCQCEVDCPPSGAAPHHQNIHRHISVVTCGSIQVTLCIPHFLLVCINSKVRTLAALPTLGG